MRELSGSSNVSSSPAAVPDVERNKTHALAELRQWTWEATQYLSYHEVREFVEGVLREVESDEP